MDSFKRERFEHMNPGVAFPQIEPLGEQRMRELRVRLANAVGFPPEVDNLAFTHHVDSMLCPLDGLDAEAEDFDLATTIRSIGVKPQNRVYINWYRYDQIDEIDLGDLSRNFHAIWYPSSDDIEVFDDTCTWILSVSHNGTVAYALFVK